MYREGRPVSPTANSNPFQSLKSASFFAFSVGIRNGHKKYKGEAFTRWKTSYRSGRMKGSDEREKRRPGVKVGREESR